MDDSSTSEAGYKHVVDDSSTSEAGYKHEWMTVPPVRLDINM